jgi:hypothetical protein
MRPFFTASALGVVAYALLVASSATARPFVPTVRCNEIVLYSKHANGPGYRHILGAVSAPPSYIPGTVHDPSSTRYPYWSKAGMWIHASTDVVVTVSVPKNWRGRAQIVWGAPGSPGTALRFEPCRSLGAEWDGYSGGFLLRAKSACVPLVFSAGNRRATLWFGVGRHC